MKYTPSPIPANFPPAVRDWLADELQRIAQALNQVDNLSLNTKAAEPAKYAQGDIQYADGTNWNPGEGEGIYFRDSAAWSKLAETAADEEIDGQWSFNANVDIEDSNLLYFRHSSGGRTGFQQDSAGQLSIKPFGGSTLFTLRDGLKLRVADLGDTDYVDMQHDGTNFDIIATNTNFIHFQSATGYKFDDDVYVEAGVQANGPVQDNNGVAGQFAFMDVASGNSRFGGYNWDTAAWQNLQVIGNEVSFRTQASLFEWYFASVVALDLDGGTMDLYGGRDFRVRDGGSLFAYEASDVDSVEINHNGTNGIMNASDAMQFKCASGLKFGLSQTSDFYLNQQMFMREQTSADSDFASYGQFWVKDDAPNRPRYTDDAGNDFWLPVSDGTTGGTGSAGSGNQYVELEINGSTYKVLHDGTV